MKKPLTDTQLEEMLKKQGQILPAKEFRYTSPAPLPLFPKKPAAILLTALLSLLLLMATLPLALDWTDEGDLPLPDRFGTGAISPSISSPLITNSDTPIHPPQTLPPSTNPPITLPLSYLPANYGVKQLTLNHVIYSDLTEKEIENLQIIEAPDFRSSTTYFSVQAMANQTQLLAARYAKVELSDSIHEACDLLYYNLDTKELVCLTHRLQALLDSLHDSHSLTVDLLNLYTMDQTADHVLYWVQEGDVFYYYLADFTQNSLHKLTIPLSGPDVGFVSPDFTYVILREPHPSGKDEQWTAVSLLNDTRLTPFGEITVFGDPVFSADGRFFLCRRTDLDGNNWLAFDSLTRVVTECMGDLCYLSGSIALTRTEDGYAAYDCSIGEEIELSSSLPLALRSTSILQYLSSTQQYTLKLYDPTDQTLRFKLEGVAAYALSQDACWLYYYKDGDDHLTLLDLIGQTGYSLPLSEEFLKTAESENGTVRYSISVSADRSFVAIGYTVEPKTEISESLLYHYESEALLHWMIEALEESDNLQGLIAQFENSRFADHPIVINTAADIYDDYVIWQVLYLYTPGDIRYCSRVLRIVEDYRTKTLTLYRGDYNPHFIPGVSGSDRLSDANFYEYGDLFVRYDSKNADYTTTCQLLRSIGRTIGCSFDYGNCFDENGKWSNTLAQKELCRYERLKNTVTSASYLNTPEQLDTLLQILARNPRTDRAKFQFTPAWRVQLISLTDADGNQVYKGWLAINSKGNYYLITEFFGDYTPMIQISKADYTALMGLYGGFLYESGLYLNPRLSGLDVNFAMGSYVRYDTGLFSGSYLNSSNLDRVEELYAKGNTSDRKLISLLFEGSDQRALLFAQIAVEDAPYYEWEGVSADGRLVHLVAMNGKITQLEISNP